MNFWIHPFFISDARKFVLLGLAEPMQVVHFPELCIVMGFPIWWEGHFES